MYRAICTNIDTNKKIIDEETDKELFEFTSNQHKPYKYHNFLRSYFTDFFNENEDAEDEVADQYLFKVALIILNALQTTQYDEDSHTLYSNKGNFNNIFKTINTFIKNCNKYYPKDGVRELHLKTICPKPEYKNYSHDIALKILDSNDPLMQKTFILAKVIIFSEDFFNENFLYRIRTHIFNKSIFKDIFKDCVDLSNDSQNFMSMFFSDYKVLEEYIRNSSAVAEILTKNNDLATDSGCNTTYDYVLLMTYIRFIINVIILLYTSRQSLKLCGENTDEKLDDKTKCLRIDIILSKIYNQIDQNLFGAAIYNMSRRDVVCFIIRKIYEDVMIHEQNNFYVGKLLEYTSHLARMMQSINAHNYDYEIKEMSDIALKEWLSGCKLNHIEMINKFWRMPKYHDVLCKRGVLDKIKDELMKICVENGFRRRQGKDPGLRRVKCEVVVEIIKKK